MSCEFGNVSLWKFQFLLSLESAKVFKVKSFIYPTFYASVMLSHYPDENVGGARENHQLSNWQVATNSHASSRI